LGTQIDIPVEIAVPHFIQDDKLEDSSGLNSNFKLSLQAVVCHRGNSVDSGHYVALVRGTAMPGSPNRDYTHTTKVWMRFDDLAPHRITVVDIEQALKEETPYLLFYQIVPIDGDPGAITAGEETTSHERNASISEVSDISVLTDVSGRPSFEITRPDEPRGRSPTAEKRASNISFQDRPPEYTRANASKTSLKVPDGSDETGSRGTLSRSSSKKSDGGGGIGRTLSKLRRKSKEVMPPPANNPDPNPAPSVAPVTVEPSNTVKMQAKAVPDAQASDRPVPQQLAIRNGGEQTPKPASLQVQPGLPNLPKTEKSRRGRSRSKARGSKPDRECVVM
jgi:hypothetical protein